MKQAHRVEMQAGEHQMSIETGTYAKQAHGAVTVQIGNTVVLVAAGRADPRPGLDFFPLTVDYRERTSAAGKFPGGFFKREGRPTNKEILTMRMIDRPIRPLFPKGYIDEVQIQCIVLSADLTLDPDILAINGASAALAISEIPFEGPIAAVRVGHVDGDFVVNPTQAQLEESDLDMLLAGHAEGVNMIEVGARELSEQAIADAIALGHKTILGICQQIDDLVKRCGKEKNWAPSFDPEPLKRRIFESVGTELEEKLRITQKQDRNTAVGEIRQQQLDTISSEGAENPEYERSQVKAAFHDIEEQVIRKIIMDGVRLDGRSSDQIRPIECEVSVLPQTHGSAVFSRGETQALVLTTLGTVSDEQVVDGLLDEYAKKFMLHYNFPPFSVGEVRRIMGPGRREIGHGTLAERSLEPVLPPPDVFPYTVRLVSDILESNGSSSMATVCGGTLALMDAGVPIKHPVAGISIGLVEENGRSVLLTDILGDEDHFGDMDFKVAGTKDGITGIQLDLKTRSLSHELIVETLKTAREARMQILKQMLQALPQPRPDISKHAPRLLTIKIDPEKIGKVIGPGGKGIKAIQAETGARVDIDDDGTVYISSMDSEGAIKARNQIEAVTEEVKVGRVYEGRVVSVKDFGAFVEIAPGQDGLCHISELDDQYVENVNSVCKIGDTMRVKVIAIDEQGRVKLSRKAVLKEGSEQEN